MILIAFLSLAFGAPKIFSEEIKASHSHKEEISKFLSDNFLEYDELFSNNKRARSEEFLWGTRYTWQYPYETIEHDKIGYIHHPNSEIRHITRSKDKIIFDATYSTDHFSRRKTQLQDDDREFFALFFGCSYIQGVGVQDEETLPSYFGQRASMIQPYNYSIGGSGPHMLLAMLESFDFKEQVIQENGVFIYVYADFHIPRANAFAQELSWLKKTPYYKKNNSGEMQYQGPIEEARPHRNRLYNFMNETIKWSSWTNRNFPPRITKSHLRYTCDLITASKDKFESIYPENEFIVWHHPIEGHMNHWVKDCLKRNNVTVIDQKEKMFVGKSHRIHLDGHPTPFANKEVADILWKDIRHFYSKFYAESIPE